jgi:16S rRNA (cytidine1402-2'-O)-methyltransferase
MLGAHATNLGLEMEQAGDERAAYTAIAPGGQRVAGDASATPAAAGGTLTIAAAPIGRPADASARLGPALRDSAVIAAEDTRRVRRLASDLGVEITGRLVSYYDDVESRRVPALLAELQAGRDVLLVTDAGMPGVSDPGYRLVAAAAAAGLPVTVLPGPSAVTAALAVSGLPTDRFAFEGFLPRRAGDRARRLADLAAERRTLVLFESPRRLGATLADLAGAFGAGRRAAVCRELTKTHEEVCRGSLAELAQWAADGVLGEITLVVAGAPEPEPVSVELAVQRVAALVEAGEPRRTAIATVATDLRISRRELYNAVMAATR